MTTQQIGPSGLPSNQTQSAAQNNQNISNDVQQWIDDQQSLSAIATDIQIALAGMEKELHSGNVFGAMMMFFTQIFPDVLSYQEGTMNVLADSQNIASDLRAFATQAQNDFNTAAQDAGNVTGTDLAHDLYDNVEDLNQWAQYLSTPNSYWNATNCPLDVNDATTIEDQTNTTTGIGSYFGTNGADWGNFTNMTNDMNSWFTAPSGSSSNPPASPAPAIKGIQGCLQQANSAVSTMATTTQTTEQFYTNQYNQLTGIDNSMQQNTISGESSFVTNQKTS
jgi:hypothetical protein